MEKLNLKKSPCSTLEFYKLDSKELKSEIKSLDYFFASAQLKLVNLKILNLNNNNIFSIEGLSNLDCQISELNLANNYVMSFRSLRKINTRKIKRLDISGNPAHSSRIALKSGLSHILHPKLITSLDKIGLKPKFGVYSIWWHH